MNKVAIIFKDNWVPSRPWRGFVYLDQEHLNKGLGMPLARRKTLKAMSNTLEGAFPGIEIQRRFDMDR